LSYYHIHIIIIFVYCHVKKENPKIIRRSFEFSFIMGNPIPAPNPMGMGMGKKSPRLLNGDGDEMALPGGEQTRCHPFQEVSSKP
jgi:hypothetical protein